jgi:hypothetical protein
MVGSIQNERISKSDYQVILTAEYHVGFVLNRWCKQIIGQLLQHMKLILNELAQ